MSKLLKAPLQEVILEVKWQLQPDVQLGLLVDSEFAFALGRFQSTIEKNFPLRISRHPEGMPMHLLSYQPAYQFRKSADEWPVIQLGPGFLTINDTEKTYTWDENFFPLIKQTIADLAQAYKNEIKFRAFSLRYIDAVLTKDYPQSDFHSFFQANINFDFSNSFHPNGKLEGFSFDQFFASDGGSNLQVSFSSGLSKENMPMFIWQIAVHKEDNYSIESLLSSISDAHQTSSSKFKGICKDEFYASFTKE